MVKFNSSRSMTKKKVKKVKPIIPSASQKRKWWRLLYIILGITLLLQFLMHPHAYFKIDAYPFFYAAFGFFACLVIIVISKSLGTVLTRPEDYYKEDFYGEDDK